MRKTQFNLRLWFAASSLITIIVICSGAAFWMTDYMTRSQLSREAELSQEFLEAIVRVNGVDMLRDEAGESVLQTPELLDFAQHITSMPGVLRVSIHAPSRRVLWSTEPRLVGQVFTDNHELDEAFAGERVIEISSPDVLGKAEHLALRNVHKVIESYIPLRALAGDNRIVGVVEFYHLPLSLDRILDEGRATIWTGAAISAAILFLVLHGIVRRGARIIEQQQQRLGHVEALAAVGQMASAVAHSLRNPMATIRSTAELWQQDLPPEAREASREIIRDVDRMDHYVRELLTYARAELHELRAVDPGRVLDAVVTKLHAAAERNRVEVTTTAPEGDRRPVLADELLLEQALTSIVTNSIEAMPQGGRLRCSVAPSAGGTVRIDISDTGVGLPASVLSGAAQPYFTTKSTGLGLGLVLARGIIERFGGSLHFASGGSAGTTVSVSLKATS